jgi:hypothetical protein
MNDLSLGEKRVRIDFNVSGDPNVDQIKRKCADIINYLEEQRVIEGKNPQYAGEKQRLISKAQTEIEDFCSTAVKALTS